MAVACFHCGLPVPVGAAFGASINGHWRAMCCLGYEAVALAITGRGLADYYRLRDAAAPASGGAAGDALPDDLTVYDAPELQARFVRDAGTAAFAGSDGPARPRREAELLLEGIRCTACVWLVEQTLVRVPGVDKVEVNYASRRARVRWDAAVSPLSRVLGAVRAVGYQAWPFEASRLALIEKSESRRRCGVSSSPASA